MGFLSSSQPASSSSSEGGKCAQICVAMPSKENLSKWVRPQEQSDVKDGFRAVMKIRLLQIIVSLIGAGCAGSSYSSFAGVDNLSFNVSFETLVGALSMNAMFQTVVLGSIFLYSIVSALTIAFAIKKDTFRQYMFRMNFVGDVLFFVLSLAGTSSGLALWTALSKDVFENFGFLGVEPGALPTYRTGVFMCFIAFAGFFLSLPISRGIYENRTLF